jgi:CMP/dCMP kinase
MNATKICTVGGLPGSGTSTLCKGLSQHTGWDYVNAGGIFRQLAAEAGVSLAAFGRRAEADPEIDRRLDARMVEVARQSDGLILEGRLTGWMACRNGLDACKIWLDAPVEVRASRLSQRDGAEVEQAFKDMERREASERQRYLEHHDINLDDMSIYDLKLDTQKWGEEAVRSMALRHLGWQEPVQ